MKKIVSIQDIACYGQCSLTVALPIISSYGIEVAILPSAVLSTHTAGFTGFTCCDLTSELEKIVDHWEKLNVSFDALYSGYIGDARQFDLILKLKKQLISGLLIVDPAMADDGKLYPALNETIVDGMRKIVQKADLTLPNLTEASFLLNRPYKTTYTKDEYEEMLLALHQMGVKIPILTGVVLAKNRIGAMAFDGKKYYFYDTLKQPTNFHGTGDIFSSVFVGKYLENFDILAALKEACEFVYEAIELTKNDSNHWYGVHFEQLLSKRK